MNNSGCMWAYFISFVIIFSTSISLLILIVIKFNRNKNNTPYMICIQRKSLTTMDTPSKRLIKLSSGPHQGINYAREWWTRQFPVLNIMSTRTIYCISNKLMFIVFNILNIVSIKWTIEFWTVLNMLHLIYVSTNGRSFIFLFYKIEYKLGRTKAIYFGIWIHTKLINKMRNMFFHQTFDNS